VYYEIGESPMPYLYLPFGPEVMSGLTFHVRTAVDDPSLPQMLRRELRASDARIRVPFAMTFAEARALPLYPSRVMAAVSSAFGTLALLLTAIGLYGVVMYAVSQRTREFAVRLALGARPADIVRGVLRHELVVVSVGLAVGTAGAVALSQLLRGFLVGSSEADLVTIVGWAAVLLATAAAASYLPARRATRIDPAAVLGGRH
jgi:ABC-type antimicrobial peptide transport system permease subunit